MNGIELLSYVTRAAFLLLALLAVIDFLRHRNAVRLNIALAFNSFAPSVIIQIIRGLTGFHTPWLSTLGSIAVVAHPYIFLWLVKGFRSVPQIISRSALVGMILSWALLIAFPSNLPVPALLVIVAYFALAEGYSAYAFVQGTVTTQGVSQRRQRLAASGLGLLGFAMVLVGAGRVFPQLSEMLQAGSQVFSILSAVCLFLGFATPRGLRRVWQLSEVQRFIEENTTAEAVTDTAQILGRLARFAQQAVGGVATRIVLRDHEAAWSVLSDTQGTAPLQESILDSIVQRAWEARQPIYEMLVAEPAASLRMLVGSPNEVRAVATVPIAVGETLLGILAVFFYQGSLFIEDDLGLLLVLSQQSALNLEYARLVELERQRGEGDIQLLLNLAKQIGQAPDFDSALYQLLEQMSRQAGWNYAEAWVPNPELSRLELRLAYIGQSSHTSTLQQLRDASENVAFEKGEGPIGSIWLERAPRWHQDFNNLPAACHEHIPLAMQAGFRSLLGVPVVAENEVLAILVFYTPGTPESADREISLVTAAVSQLAMILLRQRAQEDLARQAKDLARSNAELEQFAYVASHDLQEPLRMVTSYLQLLQQRYKGQLDADADEFIGYAVDGATRMKTLITDLLAFSRVGTHTKEFAPTDCEVVLEKALQNLRIAIEKSGAVITHDPLPSVMGDDSQLSQLLQNLIGNSIKFHSEKPPQIHVGAKQVDGFWQFCVQDNGIGFDAAMYGERVFVIFQRLHGKNEYAGTGVGLAICKKIIERHGGRIWVESQPGAGSTFFFTLSVIGGD